MTSLCVATDELTKFEDSNASEWTECSSDSDEDDDNDEDSHCSSSSEIEAEDEQLLAMLSQTLSIGVANVLSQPISTDDSQAAPMRRSSSAPSLSQVEMSSKQVSVLLNQSRVAMLPPPRCVARRGSTTHESLQVVNNVNVSHIQGESMASSSSKNESDAARQEDPTDVFNEILRGANYCPRTFTYDEVDGYFEAITDIRLQSYSVDVINAAKTSDLDFLRASFHEHNLNMNACNRFGESILHTACRHSNLDVVQFLVMEANVNLRVCDDYGRTPFHDAAWQAEPNIELVMIILKKCPDLLLISDKRGFTPLQYVRKAHWSAWANMLKKNPNDVLPRYLLEPTSDKKPISTAA
jgi:hypothetical protein